MSRDESSSSFLQHFRPVGRTNWLRWGAVALTSASLIVGCGDEAGDADSNLGGAPSESGGSSNASGGSTNGSGGASPSGGGENGSGGTSSGGATASGGGENGSGGGAQVSATCSSEVDVPAGALVTPPENFLEACKLDAPVRHVRVEGAVLQGNSLSTQILLGFDEPPAGTRYEVGDGQLRVQLYSGAVYGSTVVPADLSFTSGEAAKSEGAGLDFFKQTFTFCFDVHEGSSSAPPQIVLWVTGQKGADCESWETLTVESSFARELWWGGDEVSAVKNTSQVWVRQQGKTEVSLFEATATDRSEFLPFECTKEIAAGGDPYKPLCAIDEPVRHVRLEGLRALQAASGAPTSTQLLFGYEGSPASGQGSSLSDGQAKVQFYSGSTLHGSPKTLTVEAKGDAQNRSGAELDFFDAASTICFDIFDGSASAPPYVVLWRDGESGADCEDLSSLKIENAFWIPELTVSQGIDRSKTVLFRQSDAQDAKLTVRGRTVTSFTEVQDFLSQD